MKKKLIQRIVFITCAIAALLNPMLEDVLFLRYVLLAGSMFYLLLGWYFPLLDENNSSFKNELVGFAYSTVFFANFMDSAQMPLGSYLVYFGDLLAIILLIYMIIKRKDVKRDMLIQSIILFLVSPIPMWV